MKKRFFGIAAALTLCLVFLPGTAEAAIAVRVAGTSLEDGFYSFADGNVTFATADDYQIHFEKDAGTLTLNNANIVMNSDGSGIILNYGSKGEQATLNLIGENVITGQGKSFAVNMTSTWVAQCDEDTQLTIRGQEGASLTTSNMEWGVQAPNLAIDGVSLNMSTTGHSALRIHRDLVVQNANITTSDSGDGGDFYVDRFIRIADSTIDMSKINVGFPSIYLDNAYCPEEFKVSPAVAIENSNLTIGGEAGNPYGFILYAADGGADIKNSTLTAVNERAGISVAGGIEGGTLNLSGSSKIDTGDQSAIQAQGKVAVGEDAVVQGGYAAGKPLVNNGEISLPAGITAEQLNAAGGALHYYGGGTIKVGKSEIYHSVRVNPQDETLLDEIETRWILDGSKDIAPEPPEKEGYAFLGWYTDEGYTEAYDSNAPLTQSLMLYAKWDRETYTVRFNTQGGTSVNSQSVGKHQTASKPADPTRGGYTFGGWFTDEGCTTAYDFSAPVTMDLTLYAKWTAEPAQPVTPPSPPGGSSSDSNSSSNNSSSQEDYTPPTYRPEISQPDHGSVAVSPRNPKTGDTVTVSPTPDEGYQVDRITVTDRNGRSVAVTEHRDGTYTFTQPRGTVTIEVELIPLAELPWSSPYPDVTEDKWYADAVRFVTERGLMSGYAGGQFEPGRQLTRAQLAQILYSHAGRPAPAGASAFSDVTARAWYADAVAWAAENGIISGYGDGQFGPGRPITREQLAVMLWQYAGQPAPPNLLLPFDDADQVSPWAADALRWAVEQGILSGKRGSTLDPRGTATRAEAAQMLKNFLEKAS